MCQIVSENQILSGRMAAEEGQGVAVYYEVEERSVRAVREYLFGIGPTSDVCDLRVGRIREQKQVGLLVDNRLLGAVGPLMADAEMRCQDHGMKMDLH